MPMTREQRVAFLPRASRADKGIPESGNRVIALPPRGRAHRVWIPRALMEGLIRWRIGMGLPLTSIRESVLWIREGIEILRRMDHAPSAADIPLAQASIVALLVNQNPFEFDAGGLRMDCLLDAALSRAIAAVGTNRCGQRGFAS